MSMHATRLIGRSLVIAMSFGLILSIAGCSSSGRTKESEKAVESFQNTQKGLTKAQGEVDATLKSLDQLQTGGDLQKTYKSFISQKKDLQKSAEEAKKRAVAM